MVKAVFFDVANTLLYKPGLSVQIKSVLESHGYPVDKDELEKRHKLLSEAVEFPDETNQEFYIRFNRMLLFQLGILPDKDLPAKIFRVCRYLSWSAFPDTEYLSELTVPAGIISNWDLTLKKRIDEFLPYPFEWVIGSKESGYRKPDIRLFELILKSTGFKPEEVVVVGDSPSMDVFPAHALGMHAILVDRLNIFPFAPGLRIKTLHELSAFIQDLSK